MAGRYSTTNQPRKNQKPLTKAEEAQVHLDREAVRRRGLSEFVKRAWHVVEPGTPYSHNWHVDLIATHLEALYRGDLRNLLINIPPGCMKSRLACVFWPVWMWIQDPRIKYLAASFDSTLTLRDAKLSLELIHSSWFQARWGDRVIVPTDSAAGEYHTAAGGWRLATSVEGKTTGWHPDIKVFDDPLKPKAISPTTLKGAKEWWQGTMSTRGNPATVRSLGIMQRLHHDDLSGHLERARDPEGKPMWECLRLPMRYESRHPCVTPIGKDPRTEDGELLWPGRIPEDAVQRAEHPETGLGAQNAAAQLQQRPSQAEGAIFKRSWWKEYNPTILPRFDIQIQSWDCTFKDTDGTDFVVGQVWGKRGSEFFLLDEVRRRMCFTETCEAILATRRKWPRCTAILIEDKANGPAVESVLRKKVSGIVMINPEGGKVARANAVTGLFEAGDVRHPDPSTPGYEWVDAHREELAQFPVGQNDDRVDATSQALVWLHRKSSNLSAAMKALADAGGLGNLLAGG